MKCYCVEIEDVVPKLYQMHEFNSFSPTHSFTVDTFKEITHIYKMSEEHHERRKEWQKLGKIPNVLFWFSVYIA